MVGEPETEGRAAREVARERFQKDYDKGDMCWTEACERLATRMLKYLQDSESTKVSTRELEEQVLSPNEPRINTVRIARQAGNEKRESLSQIFRHGENEVLIASKAKWDEQLKGVVELDRR